MLIGRAAVLLLALSVLAVGSAADAPPSGSVTAGAAGASMRQSTQTVQAQSCSAIHVQAALDAAADGDTVEIPAGDCDWGAAEVARAAGITVRGAGRLLTTIRRTAAMTDYTNATLEFDCGNGGSVDISGLRLVGNDLLQTEPERLQDNDLGLSLLHGCVDFRVHDMEFSRFSHAGLSIRGRDARGVVYANDFLSNYKCQPTPVDCLGYGVVIAGDADLPRPPLALGTEDAVFVEDSYFHDNRHGIASNYGSRYVARHNTFVTTPRTRDFGMIDAHGRQGGSSQGSRSWEIYANILRMQSPAMVAADGISLRGGDGVVFGNTLEAGIAYVASLRNETCSGVYPLADQIREAYVWDNDWNPVPGYNPDAIWVSANCLPYLQEGRDFFRFARIGYLPYTYPHPLRGMVFTDGFESGSTGAWRN